MDGSLGLGPQEGSARKHEGVPLHDAKMHDARGMMQRHDAKIAQSAGTAKPKLKLFPDGYRWRKASFPTTGITHEGIKPFWDKAGPRAKTAMYKKHQ